MEKSYLPSRDADLGQWTRGFTAQVAELYASIGITSEQSAELTAANELWIAALKASKSAATRSSVTIISKNTQRDNILAVVRQLVGIIQKHPGTTDEMRAKLGLTVAKPRTLTPPPETPFDLKASLGSIGEIKLTWKNRNATGCVYVVSRQTDGGPFEILGGVGSKKFTDSTLPPGSSQVKYQIQAVRSTGASQCAFLNVSLGVSSRGLPINQKTLFKNAA